MNTDAKVTSGEARDALATVESARSSAGAPAPRWYFPAIAALLAGWGAAGFLPTVFFAVAFFVFCLGLGAIVGTLVTTSGISPRLEDVSGWYVWPPTVLLGGVFAIATGIDLAFDMAWFRAIGGLLAAGGILAWGPYIQRRLIANPSGGLKEIPDVPAAFDPALRRPERLRLCALLDAVTWMETGTVRKSLAIGPAELGEHASTLIDDGYLVERAGRGGRVWFQLSKSGRSAFRAHVNALRAAAKVAVP